MASDHLTPGVHTSSCSCPPPARRLRPPTRHPPQHHPHPPRCARASALDKPGMFSLLYGLFEYLFRKVHDPAALRCCHVLTWPYKDATGTDAPRLLRIRPAARETLQGRACEVARPSLSRTHCACLLTIHARLGFTSGAGPLVQTQRWDAMVPAHIRALGVAWWHPDPLGFKCRSYIRPALLGMGWDAVLHTAHCRYTYPPSTVLHHRPWDS